MSLLDFTILKSSRTGIFLVSIGFGVKVDMDRCGASYELVAALGFSGLGEVRVVVPKNTKPSLRKLLMNVGPSTNVGGRPYNMLDVSKRGYCQPKEVLGAP